MDVTTFQTAHVMDPVAAVLPDRQAVAWGIRLPSRP